MDILTGSPIALLVFLVCACALLAAFKNTAAEPPAPIAKPFLTDRELAMLAAIERILPAHRVHAQVAMGALLQISRRVGRTTTPADRNSFSQKIVDFVVQDRNSGAIVALIEVDDYSHNAARDAKRDQMTGRAGYTTIRIPGRARPTLTDVRRALAPILCCADDGQGGFQIPERPSVAGGSDGAR